MQCIEDSHGYGFVVDPIRSLVLDEEVKGFNHGGHRQSRGKSANSFVDLIQEISNETNTADVI